MQKRLNVVFFWHMHQPLYKDPLTGVYMLPWALFHGTKDYLSMAAILEEFPAIHQTFNVVPSLIEQINDYASGKAEDEYLRISRKPPAELTRTEKAFILKNFFQANWDNFIRPVPRYWELLRKRGSSSEDEDVEPAVRYFNDQDLLDLQVLFNLVWFDPEIIRRDPALSGLMSKGRGYTEDDKAALFERQTAVMKAILPKYAELMKRGTIELTTSPYYHPILPLLVDSHLALKALPYISMPRERFAHPEDAVEQLQRGVRLFEETFGTKPAGMWPPEGSVATEVLPLIKAAGINWIATDEDILANTLGRHVRRDGSGNSFDSFLYKPYAFDTGEGGRLHIFFRDRHISDLLGFEYAKMEPSAAADDLMARLGRIRGLFDDPQNHAVSIVLDGENAWENYRNNGRDFFAAVYSRLQSSPHFQCVTASECLKNIAGRGVETLSWCFPGSWIYHNFRVWIGHHEDNAAWDYIKEARDALVRRERELKAAGAFDAASDRVAAAWNEIYALEGSDWFWWYGDEHSSMSDQMFDSLFRRHLKRLYQLISVEPPAYLDVSILSEERGCAPASLPGAYLNPVMDGEVTNYFEWLSAGRIERTAVSGAMHAEAKGPGFLESVLYGFSDREIFFRLDPPSAPTAPVKAWSFTINFIHPTPVRVKGTVEGGRVAASVFVKPASSSDWSPSGALERAAAGAVVEAAVPFGVLGLVKGEEVRLFIDVDPGDGRSERWPAKGCVILPSPTEDFEKENWFV